MRDELTHCRCGADLRAEPTPAAPEQLVLLCRALERRALKAPPFESIDCLRGLSLDQASNLVRVLGTYGSLSAQRTPQKIHGSDALAVSWSISTIAAEIIGNWPAGFYWLLGHMQSLSSVSERGRVARVFGGLYRALYGSLGDPAFDWIRDSFEDFLAEHWSGALGRQNRRTADGVLPRLAWIASSAAASYLRVSKRRIDQLVAAGDLRYQSRTTSSGRQYLAVRKDDVERLAPVLAGEMPVAEAARRLGISRHRLARLLPQICPHAVKVTHRGSAWNIPRPWVEGWERRIANLPVLDNDEKGSVLSLGHVLRFWPVDDNAVSTLLLDFEVGKTVAAGRISAPGRGISPILFSIEALAIYRPEEPERAAALMTIPEAAEKMRVKQEVAYAIVNRGLLATCKGRVGRRDCRLVSNSDLEEFYRQFVLGRDLAGLLGKSPKATVCLLSDAAVMPIAGPSIDGCRQTIYRRADLESISLNLAGLRSPA